MQQKSSKYYIYLLISMFLWGGSFVFTKHLLIDFNPITIIFIRSFIAALVFAIFCIILYKSEFKIAKKDFKYFIGLVFFEPFLYFIFETYSLQLCDASVVSVIIATIPLFVALMAVFVFKERLSGLNFFGIFLSISGIVIMLWRHFTHVDFSMLGVLLAFGAVLSTIGYNYFLRKLTFSYSPIIIITWQNILGLIAFFPLVFIVNDAESVVSQYHALGNTMNLSFMLILAIFCSSIAFILYIDAMRTLGVARTNIFINLIPVMTAIIAFFVLKEEITLPKVLGIIMVIIGIFLVQQKRKARQNN
ncbi:MAG: DMT family transporter [Lentimicrobiaceae bacterium]|nr:DMT family transporter [Lentimicrobiaceae bacterium]